MTAQVGLAAFFAAMTVVGLAHSLVPPRRMLAGRLRPYAALARSRLGTGYADVSVVSLTRHDTDPASLRVFGPLLERLAERLAGLIDVADSETLRLRLRHAGFSDTSPEQYRMRQLAYTVAGLGLGAALGLTMFGTVGGTLAFTALLGFPGATLQRNRVQRAITERRAKMRNEVFTVAQLIAVHIRTGHGPVDAIRAVCTLGRGPVIEELREALGWIGGGTSPQRAYDKLAEATPEPAAARLYRLLSSSARSGGDIADALLAVGNDLRSQRREEIARSAVKRRTAMLVPLLLLIAPIMVLFVGAALPSFVLGAGR